MARMWWYSGQYALAARLGAAPEERQRRDAGGGPGLAALTREMRALVERDWRNIEEGLYRPPHDLLRNPLVLVDEAVRFFRDLPVVSERRRRRGGQDVRDGFGAAAGLPDYYLQNFHFQTGGYLTPDSARLYDQQVEVLFGGCADAMRRQALVPLGAFRRGRAGTPTRLLDVAAGNGRFLTFVKDNHPRLEVLAVDLSQAYLAEARRRLAPWSRAHVALAAAEALPLADASVDLVTSVFLFHELPRPVRRHAAAEMARVLRPGGRLVLVDSLQQGDRPDLQVLLDRFPQIFHEPYYADYVRQDLAPLFTEPGLQAQPVELAFLSKVMVFDKPA
jgi:ubiquinone/menaquinone biosynthesis C-methylase UbiE